MADTAPKETDAGAAQVPPVVVKKYANRRLYNTESSSYITLENLADMVRAGRDFVVYDAKTGEDITRSVLTQIIVEEEGKGHNLLPTNFLRQLIGFYGGGLQGVVPGYLDQAMKAFTQHQEQMQTAMKRTVGSMSSLFPFGNMEEISRQNMAMIDRAWSMFAPFKGVSETGGGAPPDPAEQENAALRAEVERLRRELASKEGKKG
jgi:polyhydroxyalkanoate synthesis repressor PhaR